MSLNISDLVLYSVVDANGNIVLKSVCSIKQIGSLGGIVAKEECRLSALTLGTECVSIDRNHISKNFGKIDIHDFKKIYPELLV